MRWESKVHLHRLMNRETPLGVSLGGIRSGFLNRPDARVKRLERFRLGRELLQRRRLPGVACQFEQIPQPANRRVLIESGDLRQLARMGLYLRPLMPPTEQTNSLLRAEVVRDEQYLASSFEQSEIASSVLVHAIPDGLRSWVNHCWANLHLCDLPGSQRKESLSPCPRTKHPLTSRF